MGLFERLRRSKHHPSIAEVAVTPTSAVATPTTPALRPGLVVMLAGNDGLELVGEASYQDALWSICGGVLGDRIRHRIDALLIPEPENPYDPNAIRVEVQGRLVAYFCRDDAAEYQSGLQSLMNRHGGHVGLRGVIVGGGQYPDGPGRLGVWLDHDPGDFGVTRAGTAGRSVLGRPAGGSMRTGFADACASDASDDSYDLSWYADLPDGDLAAIAKLRELLAHDPDPIDRHYQFVELEKRLYRCRDLHAAALDEFDDACRQHDAEMESICTALRRKWQKVPLLETYRQMAIRQQKRKDWEAVRWWTERGLQLYGDDAAKEEAVEDLLKRRDQALAKLGSRDLNPRPQVSTSSPVQAPEVELLACSHCGTSFERVRTRGRKPQLCPSCRG